ncbi:oxidoreductase [Klebsiella pneumoniae]|nr:oxidoreductase [Klebsiella pneumoniae]
MNVGDKAVFDLAMLEKLGMKTVETTTPLVHRQGSF